MSIISVDFVSLERQAACLDALRLRVEEINGRISDIAYSLDGMKPDGPVSELRASAKKLNGIIECIEKYRSKLIRITELYAECENRIFGSVKEIELSLLLLSSSGAVPKGLEIKAADKIFMPVAYAVLYCSDSFIKPDDPENRYFGSHSVINDSWLEELVYDDIQADRDS